MKRFVQMLVAAMFLVGTAEAAEAAECVGVSYPGEQSVAGTTLTLNGLGIREATIFSVDVYVAALYLEEKSGHGSAIAASDGPKQLRMKFVRGVERGKIVDAYRDSFKKTAKAVGGGIGGKVDKFIGWMTGVESGDEQVLTYIPGEGVRVKTNGDVHGTIAGESFAEALFLIWLGDNPPNAGLKRGLLGGECG